MDGFFVAKFKVEKRKKAPDSTAAADLQPQRMLNDRGELVEVANGATSAFNDDEDAKYIEGTSVLRPAAMEANQEYREQSESTEEEGSEDCLAPSTGFVSFQWLSSQDEKGEEIHSATSDQGMISDMVNIDLCMIIVIVCICS